MTFVKINDRQSLSKEGILRQDLAGHGVLAGEYRPPTKRFGRYYYRVYNPRTPVYRVEAKRLMEEQLGPGAGAIVNDEWYTQVRYLCDIHNKALKLNEKARGIPVEKKEEVQDEATRFFATENYCDLFQNPHFFDVTDDGRIVRYDFRQPHFDDVGVGDKLKAGEEAE